MTGAAAARRSLRTCACSARARVCSDRAAFSAARVTGRSPAAARAAISEHNRARSQRAQLARLRRRVEAPVKTLPFLFEPELGREGARTLSKRLG